MRELSVEEANALLPELHRIVSAQLRLQDDVAGELATLHALLGEFPSNLSVREGDGDEVRASKRRVQELLRALEEGWSRVAELGGLVKDPQAGLVDFPGRVDGEPVLLCWRFGEESIDHYHGHDEGFRGRRPLPNVARQRMFN
ncbi:MAG: DUF2203 domain-containing protein [Polyangiaceae bacterium]|nr:DUF2203 domain-containing protein [Polyangiaceae bacterium]